MKTAISIPDKVFRSAEAFARHRRMSRSALFSTAVEEYIQHHRQEKVTNRLDEIYSDQPSSLDPMLQELQDQSTPTEKW